MLEFDVTFARDWKPKLNTYMSKEKWRKYIKVLSRLHKLVANRKVAKIVHVRCMSKETIVKRASNRFFNTQQP